MSSLRHRLRLGCCIELNDTANANTQTASTENTTSLSKAIRFILTVATVTMNWYMMACAKDIVAYFGMLD